MAITIEIGGNPEHYATLYPIFSGIARCGPGNPKLALFFNHTKKNMDAAKVEDF